MDCTRVTVSGDSVDAGAPRADHRPHFAARDRRQLRFKFATTTVEQHQFGVALETQHIAHVMGGGGRQYAFAAGGEFDVDMDARHGVHAIGHALFAYRRHAWATLPLGLP